MSAIIWRTLYEKEQKNPKERNKGAYCGNIRIAYLYGGF
jgi:hypothetical protein